MASKQEIADTLDEVILAQLRKYQEKGEIPAAFLNAVTNRLNKRDGLLPADGTNKTQKTVLDLVKEHKLKLANDGKLPTPEQDEARTA